MLLAPGQTAIDNATQTAIDLFFEMGGKIGISTKSEVGQLPFFIRNGRWAPLVLHGGAAVYNAENEEFLFDAAFSQDVMAKVADILQMHEGVGVVAYSKTYAQVVLQSTKATDLFCASTNLPYAVKPLVSYNPLGVLQYTFFGSVPELQKVLHELEENLPKNSFTMAEFDNGCCKLLPGGQLLKNAFTFLQEQGLQANKKTFYITAGTTGAEQLAGTATIIAIEDAPAAIQGLSENIIAGPRFAGLAQFLYNLVNNDKEENNGQQRNH